MMRMTELRLDSWTKVLLHLYNDEGCKLQDILRETQLSFAYTINVIQILERDKYIRRVAKGRTKIITLTAKGKDFAQKVNALIVVMQK